MIDNIDLLRSVAEEREAMDKLVHLLEQEQKFLIENDYEKINSNIEVKSKALVKISECAHKRYKLLQQMGFEADEGGMRIWLETNTENAPQESWRELVKTTSVARELNRINGVLIGKQLSRNNAALQVLSNSHRNSGVYGPDGQTTRNISRGISV